MTHAENRLTVEVVDRWTLSFAVDLDRSVPCPTQARTTIVQPRGYRQSLAAQPIERGGRAHWQLTYPLSDEGAYQPMDRRCDWRMGEYHFAAELLVDDQVMASATASLSPLDFMPHTFRGVGPLIGQYSQYLLECAPDRPVYIDADTMSVSLRGLTARTEHCTMDVVEPGADRPLAGPWTLSLGPERTRHRFSSAGWPRGEYWVRLRPHRDGQPIGAYMVRAVWKEVLPPEKALGVRSVAAFQPVAGTGGFSTAEHVSFQVDPMQPRPDDWIVAGEKPWESAYLGLYSDTVEFQAEQGEYRLDLTVNDVDVQRPVPPTVCRIVSDDGLHWRRPKLGRVEYRGSTDNNIVGYSDRDAAGQATWPLRAIHRDRVAADPSLLPDLDRLSIRFRDPERDGPVEPHRCFVKSTGWDLLALCAHVDPEVQAHFSDDLRHPDHNRYQAYAIERRGNELLLLSRRPLLRAGSGMDLHHTTESFRYTLEDRSTGTYYFYFRPGAPAYPPHYAPLDNIHQIRRVLAVLWTRDYLHWERRFILAPDEEDGDGTQFYHLYLHNQRDEAAQSSPGALLAGIPAVDGGRVYLGSLTTYDAHRSQMWPELLWTADFIHWHRLTPRRKLIPNGPPGCYSFGAVRHSGIIAEIDSTWWMAFLGYRLPYKYPNPARRAGGVEAFKQQNLHFAQAPDFEDWDQFYQFCKAGYGINPALAIAPAGRLVHAEPATPEQPGELRTTPVQLRGNLLVNATSEPGGSVRVEVQDEEGMSLPGFELAACRPLEGDELRHRVSWSGRTLAEVRSRSVRLRFVLDRARLYGYCSD